jgi:hypothetical protein
MWAGSVAYFPTLHAAIATAWKHAPAPEAYEVEDSVRMPTAALPERSRPDLSDPHALLTLRCRPEAIIAGASRCTSWG